jgi:hypothetical protein
MAELEMCMKMSVVAVILTITLCAISAQAQPSSTSQSTIESPVVGTVALLRSSTLIVRTDDNRYVVFALDRDTVRPRALANGAQVSVDFTAPEPGDEVRTATTVTLTGTQPTTPQAITQDAIPANVRRLERQIAANVRRYRAGIRAGVALDPELISLGAHATFGPIFTRRLLARPNVEFAYGELTTSLALNLEGIYRLTPTMPRNQWSPYAGGGPTLGFGHRGISTETSNGRSFDFGEYRFNRGMNLLIGVEKPNGVFIELKSTIYTDPHVRLLFGVTF